MRVCIFFNVNCNEIMVLGSGVSLLERQNVLIYETNNSAIFREKQSGRKTQLGTVESHYWEMEFLFVITVNITSYTLKYMSLAPTSSSLKLAV